MSSVQTAITNFRYVKLADLIVDHTNWQNPRTITGLDDSEIAELGADIKARGIQVALNVQKITTKGGGVSNLVLDGQRRFLAASEFLPKDADIPVVDRSIEPIELTPEAADQLMLDVLAIGTKREGLSSYELSEVAERLRKRGRTLGEIGRAIGRDESWVSKILKARSTATTKLMHKWRKGEVTDEQFKDLAAVKDPEKQSEATKEVVKLRESGDQAEARVRAKEIAETAKRETKTNGHATNGHSSVPKVAVTGDQVPMFEDRSKPAKPAPAKPEAKKMTSRAVLEDLLGLADKRPATHDYVKGVMDGVRFALGEIGPEEFSKAWKIYLARVDGKRPAKKAKAKKAAAPKGKTKGKKARRK
jgi:hypothetical protein